MAPTLNGFIDYLTETIKQNQTGPVECTWCNNSANIIKYGTYHRYAFTGGELIPIQRYLCKRELCKRTFSILPHPFLRITRFSLCIFRMLLNMIQQKMPVSQIAFSSDLSWSAVHRAIQSAGKIFSWIRQEAVTDPQWAPCPCMNPPQNWSHFIRMFAAKFYPKRYGKSSPTQ